MKDKFLFFLEEIHEIFGSKEFLALIAITILGGALFALTNIGSYLIYN